MARAEGTFSGRSQFRLIMDTSEGTPNAANNTSPISWSVYIYMDVASSSYSFGPSSWSASINGVTVGGGSFTYDFRGKSAGYSLGLGSNTYTYTHLSDGSGTPGISVSASADSPLGSASGSSSQPTTNFVRVPQAPAAPAITRTGTGTSVTVASAVAADATGSPAPPAITDYKYRYSTNDSTWTEVTGMGTDRVDTFGPTVPITVSGTQVYYFQTAATNSEGYGAWSASGVGYAAPTITSLTRAGLSATVAVSPNASNGGSTITSHVVQASSDQTTWTSQTISGAAGGSTTFSSLSPGRTWYFRAFATNAAGVNSPVTATQSIFISAYGKRYDSTLSDFATINTGKRYDASGAWVDIQTTKKYADASIVAPGVSGSGSVVTYNATAHPYSVGDVVSITGVSPTAYNLTNVTITSIATNSFTVNSTATGTYVSGGTIVGWATFK